MQRMLFPAEEKLPSFEPDPLERETPPQKSYDPNVLNIDFEALEQGTTDEEIREMHHYFSTRTPSYKNEYTGKFAGKNLIMITAEAFSSWAVDPSLTPTLYRLSHEGFVFQNFYTPLWWVSTSDGEYVSCTSLIPKSGKQSFGLSSSNSLPFCMGNQLREDGYGTRAYHDHTYTYYKRNQTHPNMGYDYKGLGNGLKMTPSWPESDVEMMKLTLPEFLGSTPFHTYYMTVSGHLEYSFSGNQMAYNHRSEVKDLPLSEQAKAYLACQIELDRAITYLLEQLEAAGQLENTVICLYPDHYPYGLSNKSIEELAGKDLSESLELYRSTMILWSGDQKEPVVIEKPCSNLDILPTLSNLFGLDYDSRLLMGRDILSSDPGLVVFSDTSFLTDLGTYNAKTDTFTAKEGAVVPEGYAKEMLQSVQDKFLYSGKILLHDYYRTLGLSSSQ
jgi:phosphoglycerol transferase MdoB-like AlkP superfamily enzyme